VVGGMRDPEACWVIEVNGNKSEGGEWLVEER
jgi:hypothetical protein